MRKPDERESGFHALSEMANAVGKELKSYLHQIMSILKDAVRMISYCHILALFLVSVARLEILEQPMHY